MNATRKRRERSTGLPGDTRQNGRRYLLKRVPVRTPETTCSGEVLFSAGESLNGTPPSEDSSQPPPAPAWRPENPLVSFRHATEGIFFAVRTQRNLRVHLTCATLVLWLGFLFRFSNGEMALLFVVCGLVLVAEMVNTAIETVVDMITTQYHPGAKAAKDVGAGAVLVASVVAVLVAICLFLTPARWEQILAHMTLWWHNLVSVFGNLFPSLRVVSHIKGVAFAMPQSQFLDEFCGAWLWHQRGAIPGTALTVSGNVLEVVRFWRMDDKIPGDLSQVRVVL